MKAIFSTLGGLSVMAVLTAATPVLAATADDAAWVAKCVSDNADQGQGIDVVTTYCTCMNSKMSDGETQSITTWEKGHPAEREACSKVAGWK